MNVAIFGGTFDPVHRGHLAIARAAQQRFQLGRIYFVPADIPPHKQQQPITPFHHRYAMVVLATQGEKNFLPSLMEAPGEEALRAPSFSIGTVRRFRAQLARSDRLFFLVGIDAFLDISTWRQPEDLLHEAEFIIASRPGFSLADVARALPESLRPADSVTRPFQRQPAAGDIVLGGVVLHLLPETHEDISATQIRSAATAGRPLTRWVPDAVADYIRKTHLYKAGSARHRAAAIAATSGRGNAGAPAAGKKTRGPRLGRASGAGSSRRGRSAPGRRRAAARTPAPPEER